VARPLNREQPPLSVARPEHPPAHNHALIGYTTQRDTIGPAAGGPASDPVAGATGHRPALAS
jgi:hypothetical protein